MDVRDRIFHQFGGEKAAFRIITENMHPCCDPVSPSAIWTGTPTGKVIKIDNIETYISQHKREGKFSGSDESTNNSKRAVIFLTEAHEALDVRHAEQRADDRPEALP